MRFSIVILLGLLHEALSHNYPKIKKYQSAGGEWDNSVLPRRSRQASSRSQQIKEDAVVSPDGSVRVEAVVRTRPQEGGHVAEKKRTEPQVLRSAPKAEPSIIRAVEPALAAIKEHAQSAPIEKHAQANPTVILSSTKSKAPATAPKDATILIYDTIASPQEDAEEGPEQVSHLLEQVQTIGWKNKLVGAGSTWQGWGSKLMSMMEELRKLDSKEFVIVSDSHDVFVNTAPGGMKHFLKNFQELTGDHPGAVVVGAEGSCCAAAMNLAGGPGKLIGEDGSRTQYSCSSGIGDCLHKGPEFDQPWTAFFKEVAEKRGHKDAPFPYLNAGILAGYAGDIVRVYEFLQAKPQEDDQALLSEAMYRRPDWIVVDYQQRLFGSNSQQGCQYDWEKATADNIGHFINSKTGFAPLFIQTSGHFMDCYLEKTS